MNADTNLDPVTMVEAMLADLNAQAERAVRAALSGDPAAAVTAIGTMRALLNGRRDFHQLVATKIKARRRDPALRAALIEAAKPGLRQLDKHVRALAQAVRARRARVDALRETLRARSTVHSTYTARGASGVRMVDRVVRHAVAITA